jgi:hypothetical protein
MIRAVAVAVACIVAVTLAPHQAAAHELGQSYVFLRVHDDSIAIRLEITVADLGRALGLPWEANQRVSPAEVEAHLDAILEYVRERFFLGAAGEPFQLRFNGHDVRHVEIADYVLLSYVAADLSPVPDHVEVAYPVLFEIDSNHRNLLVIEHNFKTGTFNNESNVSLIFSPSNPRQTLDLSSSSVMRGFMAFIWLGVWHIWIGIDHILFLIALILPSVLRRGQERWQPVPSFRPALYNVVIIVSFFTIAHSITLSLAALDIVRLPARFVEATIAASIAAAALYNLFPQMRVREWMIAFAFGLFHGFGFANVLSGLGLEPRYLALSLLGFNVGVELGQVAVIGVIFPVLYLLRTHAVYRPLVRYASVGMIMIALVWFVERAFEVPLTGYASALMP